MAKGKARRLEKDRRRASKESRRAAKRKAAPKVYDRPLRHAFIGKVRRGDATDVRLEFSGLLVPFDKRMPSYGLRERTAIARAVEAKSKGNLQ
jgi:hypothetical protein